MALKPLSETFGLTTIASLTGWLLIGAVVGFGRLASSLYRSGDASARLIVVGSLGRPCRQRQSVRIG